MSKLSGDQFTPWITALRQELTPKHLLPSMVAGVLNGVLLVIFSISYAVLIWSNDLPEYVPAGIGLLLISNVILGIFVAIFTSLPGTIGNAQDISVVVFVLVAKTITTDMGFASRDSQFLTLVAAIITTSVITGLFFLTLGTFKLGGLVRFIPYPVVGGFLAGTGWLLCQSSIGMMADIPLGISQLSQLWQLPILIRWLPGLCFALLLVFIWRRYNHFLIIPGMMVSSILLFYGILWLTGTPLPLAHELGLFSGPFPAENLWHPVTVTMITQADWSEVLMQTDHLASLPLLAVLGLLLSVSALEVSLESDIDLNRELRVTGIANLIAGLGGGGIVGFVELGQSVLNYKMGATSRLVGIFASGICALALFSGVSFFSFVPEFLLGGLVLFLGVDLLVEWVYESWFKLPKADYWVMILILFVISTVGLLPGVIVGIIAALILFAVNYSQSEVSKYRGTGVTNHSNVQRPLSQSHVLTQKGDQIYILQLQGFIFFGTAYKLLNLIQERLLDEERDPLKFILLDFRWVRGLDSSAILSFMKLRQMAEKREICLLLTQIAAKELKQLVQGEVIDLTEERCKIFPDLDRGLEWCENQILEMGKFRRRRFLPLALQLKIVFPDAGLVSQLMTYLELVKVPAGTFLFRQGDASDGLYFVESGQVSVVIEPSPGVMKRLRTYQTGTILGEMGLYGNAPRSASVIADESSRLYHLSTHAFETIEKEEPRLAAMFHKFIVNLLAERLHFASASQNLLE